MEHTYERVTFRAEGAKRSTTVMLGDVRVAGPFLLGTEVDVSGEVIWREKGTTSRSHMVSVELVSKRVPFVMDNHYGMLVEA